MPTLLAAVVRSMTPAASARRTVQLNGVAAAARWSRSAAGGRSLRNVRPSDLPLFTRLRELARQGPVVVAHRGNSHAYPENTLSAFTAAATLGAPMQEFDVQVTADGQLVCLHDATLDRTTDAAARLGPGALLAQTTLAQVQQLDAGAWKGAAHAGARVPTLAAALAAMLPRSIPMIEHKAGSAVTFT